MGYDPYFCYFMVNIITVIESSYDIVIFIYTLTYYTFIIIHGINVWLT